MRKDELTPGLWVAVSTCESHGELVEVVRPYTVTGLTVVRFIPRQQLSPAAFIGTLPGGDWRETGRLLAGERGAGLHVVSNRNLHPIERLNDMHAAEARREAERKRQQDARDWFDAHKARLVRVAKELIPARAVHPGLTLHGEITLEFSMTRADVEALLSEEGR